MANRPTMMRFSRPVSFGSIAAYWPAVPISRRTRAGAFTASIPATNARPASGTSRVVRIRMVVDLPDPFGPSSAEHRTVRNAEVHTVQGGHLSEALDQPFGDDRQARIVPSGGTAGGWLAGGPGRGCHTGRY
jgi:hypothetical protein